jgi:polar amino acid transport system substrate-binding protein
VRARALSLCTFALAIGCGLPRDPDDTLERVRGGVVRVGVSHNPPWVDITSSGADGIEAELIENIARDLGARIEWTAGAESELLTDLEERKLDVVLGGLTDDSPWKHKVALTRPFFEDPETRKKHVLAMPAGENAWLLYVERELRGRDIARVVQ